MTISVIRRFTPLLGAALIASGIAGAAQAEGLFQTQTRALVESRTMTTAQARLSKSFAFLDRAQIRDRTRTQERTQDRTMTRDRLRDTTSTETQTRTQARTQARTQTRSRATLGTASATGGHSGTGAGVGGGNGSPGRN